MPLSASGCMPAGSEPLARTFTAGKQLATARGSVFVRLQGCIRVAFRCILSVRTCQVVVVAPQLGR